MKQECQDKIDDYLLDRMPAAERLAFENELETDIGLKDQFLFTENLRHALKSRNEKLAAMKEWDGDYEWQYDSTSIQARIADSGYNYCPTTAMKKRQNIGRSIEKKFLYWFAGLTALFISVFFIIRNKSQVGNDKWDSITFPEENGVSHAGTEYSEIKSLIENKEFNEALALIDDEILFLEKLLNEDAVKDLRDKLLWLKFQALVGLNRKSDAKDILNMLRNKEGNYKIVADSIYNMIR